MTGPVSAITSRTGLQTQFSQRSTLFLKIFEGVFLEHAVRLKEAIHLDTGQAEHLAELRFGDASSPEFFQGEGFQGAARQVTRRGHGADEFIRDLKGDIHEITVTRPSNGVKQMTVRCSRRRNAARSPAKREVRQRR